MMTLKEMILDSLADDYESIIQIKNYLEYRGFKEDINKTQELINHLLSEMLIYINNEISNETDGIWYGMTAKGREMWNKIAEQDE